MRCSKQVACHKLNVKVVNVFQFCFCFLVYVTMVSSFHLSYAIRSEIKQRRGVNERRGDIREWEKRVWQ